MYSRVPRSPARSRAVGAGDACTRVWAGGASGRDSPPVTDQRTTTSPARTAASRSRLRSADGLGDVGGGGTDIQRHLPQVGFGPPPDQDPSRPSNRSPSSLSCSTTSGSRSVVTSPSGSPLAMFLSSRRMILPERVLGRSAPNITALGLAILPMRSPTHSRSSPARSSEASLPARLPFHDRRGHPAYPIVPPLAHLGQETLVTSILRILLRKFLVSQARQACRVAAGRPPGTRGAAPGAAPPRRPRAHQPREPRPPAPARPRAGPCRARAASRPWPPAPPPAPRGRRRAGPRRR